MFRSFEPVLSGSMTAFKKKERPQFTPKEAEVEKERRYLISEGITTLRKIRTLVFKEGQGDESQQMLLQKAHRFSALMGDFILQKSLNYQADLSTHPYIAESRTLSDELQNEAWDSKHCIVPSTVLLNLEKATDDIIVNIESTAGSAQSPNHKLSELEIDLVLEEFLKGTNDLNNHAISNLFKPNTKVGGVLTGGMIYLSIAKGVVDKYAQEHLKVDDFVIAVDAANKRVAIQESEGDMATENVFVLDDMIDKGGAMLAATYAAGDHFGNAYIYSGKGDAGSPTQRAEKRRQEKTNYLFELFQDFASATVANDKEVAYQIYAEAERYAEQNSLELPGGWKIRKEKMENGIFG
ncbi:MAG: hypothetical protein WC107_02365 [Patescibacteria group bacterium]